MRRREAMTVAVLIVLLGVANAVAYLHWTQAAPVAPERTSAWQHWQGLTDAEQARRVRQYQQLSERHGGLAALHRARAFLALPVEERQRLRQIARVLRETIAAQSPGRRATWLRMPLRSQAYMVYRQLAAESPERLEALQASSAGRD